jgi:pseudouridine kinase
MAAQVVCFGGAHIDCSAYSLSTVVAGASNPVRRRTSVGGVARNVSVRLRGEGVAVDLVSRIGEDAEGNAVLADLAGHGVGSLHVQRDPAIPTANYSALIDPDGELSVAWADMAIYDAVTPETLDAEIAKLPPASGWFIDSNLPATTLAWIASRCPQGTWLAADTISPTKALRLREVLPRLDYLFCNRTCAATLLDRPEKPASAELARGLTALGLGAAIVTDGPRGLALASDQALLELPPPVEVVTGDVTGAGDSLVAGTLAGLVAGEHITRSIQRGLAAARVTLGRRGA